MTLVRIKFVPGQSRVSLLEDLMTAHARTRPPTAPPYYLGRPAALWLAVFGPRPAARK